MVNKRMNMDIWSNINSGTKHWYRRGKLRVSLREGKKKKECRLRWLGHVRAG